MRLVRGSGSEDKGACWMSAIHWYTRNGKNWTDQPKCVSPVIRPICIQLNDLLDDGERERMIGPHLFAPVGTNTGQADDTKRSFHILDTLARKITPFWFRYSKKPNLIAMCNELESLAPIVNKTTADIALPVMKRASASAAAYSDAYAYANAYADADAYANASAYAYAHANANAYANAYAYAYASDSDDAHAYAKKINCQQTLDLILELCVIGSADKSCAVRTQKELLCYLDKK